jgi:hypothetical protein
MSATGVKLQDLRRRAGASITIKQMSLKSPAFTFLPAILDPDRAIPAKAAARLFQLHHHWISAGQW